MVNKRRKIILASASPRRAKLLRQLGLKFTIFLPRIKESKTLESGPAELVKVNALKKAKVAARKFKQGIVIGADTIVLVKKQVIGKPRNYSQAREFLELFSQYPHWVYTGLAIIDIEKNKCYRAYEKTKVIFHKLTDAEIDKYLSRNLSLGRAGGIDIEGEARELVKEIRGDFYNVVGLPLRKLECLLRRI